MNKSIYAAILLSASCTFAAGTASSNVRIPAPASSTPAEDFVEKYILGRLSVGTRITSYEFLDDSRSGDDGFLGTIIDEEAEQDYAPTKFFVNYFFNDYWGAELTTDKMEADLGTRLMSGAHGGDSDGVLKVDGPIITVVGRYLNDSAFTPYGGAGVAFLSGSVNEAAWWHFGYSDSDAYKADGSPTKPSTRKRRHFEVDDGTGLVLTLGVDFAINTHWSLDLYGRYMNAELDAEAIGTQGHTVVERIPGTFVLDNLAFGFGAKYTF